VISGVFLRAVLNIDWNELEPIDFLNMTGVGFFGFLTIRGTVTPYITVHEGVITINKIINERIVLQDIQSISVSYGLFANILIKMRDGTNTKIDAWPLKKADIDFLLGLVPKN
jgi:hypothetical protein